MRRLARSPAALVPLLLVLMGPALSAQDRGSVGSQGSLVTPVPEWAGVIYARAAAAAYAGDVEALDAALEEIDRLPGGSVDASLVPRGIPSDPGVGRAELEAIVLNVIFPYLHPEAVGQTITCGPVQSMTFTLQDDTGVQTALERGQLSCEAGPTSFAYVGSRYQERGEAAIEVEGFQLGEMPISVTILPTDKLQIAPLSTHGTLLAVAAGQGHTGVLDRLIRAGAALDGRSTTGRTALMDAAAAEQTGTLSALISAGASIDLTTDDGQTALHLAAQARRAGAVDLLLSGGANPRASDEERRTPLHLVVDTSGSPVLPIIEGLAAAGADVDAVALDGSRPLHVALVNGHGEAATTLLALGADPSSLDGNGRSPTTLAIRSGLDILDQLVAAGADLNEQDGEGRTPLHHAVLANDRPMMERVLALGGRIDARDGAGSTPFMIAAESGATDALNFLLGAGADIRATDDQGNTPLHRAAAAGQDRTAELLLRAGASRGAGNNAGRSPQDVAGANGHGNVQSLFRHTKFLHLALLKGAVGFTKLAEPQHESSVGWEFALGLGLKVHERVRLQGEVAWATRTTDPMEEGPIVLPGSGDYYYATYSIDIRPTARIALGNPYRTHVYLVGGASLSTIEEVEILDWIDTDADGTIVTDQSDLEMTSVLVGLGIQGTLGRTITSAELVVTRGSEVRLDRFMGSMGAVSFGLSFAW